MTRDRWQRPIKTNIDERPTPDPQSTERLQSLKHASVRSGAIVLASQIASLIIQLTSTVLLSRLLSPLEYGVMAMVMSVTTFAGIFRDMGLSTATIQHDSLTRDQLSSLFWINVATGATLTALFAALSPIVAWYYATPELTALTSIVSLCFVLGSVGTQPTALLSRDMRFGKIAIANLSAASLGLVVTVILAILNFGYWSLAYGQIASSLIGSVLLLLFSGLIPTVPRTFANVRHLVAYGANIVAFDFVNYFHRNLDNLIIGRYWGAESLGLYSRAYALLMFPINNIRGPVYSVALPAMSRLKDDPEQFRAYYRRICTFLAFTSMPLTAYLYVAAEPIIVLALGSKWLEVVPIFRALAIVGFLQSTLTVYGLVALCTGNSRRYLVIGIINTVCSCLGFCAGLAYGPVGVANGYAIATYATAYPLLALAFYGTHIRLSDFGLAIARPAAASLTAAMCVSGLSYLTSTSHLLAVVSLGSCEFAVLYLGIYAILPGGWAELTRFVLLQKAFRSLKVVG